MSDPGLLERLEKLAEKAEAERDWLRTLGVRLRAEVKRRIAELKTLRDERLRADIEWSRQRDELRAEVERLEKRAEKAEAERDKEYIRQRLWKQKALDANREAWEAQQERDKLRAEVERVNTLHDTNVIAYIRLAEKAEAELKTLRDERLRADEERRDSCIEWSRQRDELRAEVERWKRDGQNAVQEAQSLDGENGRLRAEVEQLRAALPEAVAIQIDYRGAYTRLAEKAKAAIPFLEQLERATAGTSGVGPVLEALCKELDVEEGKMRHRPDEECKCCNEARAEVEQLKSQAKHHGECFAREVAAYTRLAEKARAYLDAQKAMKKGLAATIERGEKERALRAELPGEASSSRGKERLMPRFTFSTLGQVIDHLETRKLPGKPIEAPISKGLEPDPEPGGRFHIEDGVVKLVDAEEVGFELDVEEALEQALVLLGVPVTS